jgi:hypothetical protein
MTPVSWARHASTAPPKSCPPGPGGARVEHVVADLGGVEPAGAQHLEDGRRLAQGGDLVVADLGVVSRTP